MAWSPYKETVINYVRNHPGCCKFDVAARCTYNGRRCPSKQYYIVNTAIKNGWIVALSGKGGAYALYVPDCPVLKRIREEAAVRAAAEADEKAGAGIAWACI